MKQVGKATPDRVRRFQKIGNDLCEFQEVVAVKNVVQNIQQNKIFVRKLQKDII